MNELKEYQYLHHPLLRLNQRGWWREQSRPPMLNRASFSQKSEMRLCRKQELINGNRPSSITFPTIMYLPGILSAYMLHFPTQNLESNLRDSVKLTTDPTSSVVKHCDRDVHYDHWYFTVSDWVRILHLYDDKITKISLETQECWSLLTQESAVMDICVKSSMHTRLNEKKWDQNNISDYITSLIICTSWLVDTYDISVYWRAADIKKRIFFFFQNSAFYHYSRDLTDFIS